MLWLFVFCKKLTFCMFNLFLLIYFLSHMNFAKYFSIAFTSYIWKLLQKLLYIHHLRIRSSFIKILLIRKIYEFCVHIILISLKWKCHRLLSTFEDMVWKATIVVKTPCSVFSKSSVEFFSIRQLHNAGLWKCICTMG